MGADVLELQIAKPKADAEKMLALTAITTPEQAEWVNAIGRTSAAMVKEVEAYHEKACKATHEAWKIEVNRRDTTNAPFEAAKKHAAGLLGAWNAKLEADRRKRQAEADAAARKLADDLKVEEAAALEQAGDHVTAAAVMAAPAPIIQAVVASAAPKPAGFSGRTYYRGEVENFMALVKAVAEGKESIQALIPHQTYIDARATSDKDLFTMPGVTLKKSTGGSFR